MTAAAPSGNCGWRRRTCAAAVPTKRAALAATPTITSSAHDQVCFEVLTWSRAAKLCMWHSRVALRGAVAAEHSD